MGTVKCIGRHLVCFTDVHVSDFVVKCEGLIQNTSSFLQPKSPRDPFEKAQRNSPPFVSMRYDTIKYIIN